MAQFRTYQACLSASGWQPVEINSSDGTTVYTVLVNPWGNRRENVCHCEGYNYRGQCRHQDEAAKAVCGWTELDPDRVQNVQQAAKRECPKCGRPTEIKIEVIG